MKSTEIGLLITLAKILQEQMREVQEALRQKGVRRPKLDENLASLDTAFRHWRLGEEEKARQTRADMEELLADKSIDAQLDAEEARANG